MKKKTVYISAFLAVVISMGLLSGCTKMGDNKEYKTICTAQENLLSLSSGKISVSSRYENENKSEEIKSELTFLKNGTKDSSAISYLQTQFDNKGKTIYCDFSNGEKSEQWFIGKGWSESALPTCTVKNPHRYLRLIANKQSKESIKKIECVEIDSKAKEYTMELNPVALNKTVYENADFTVISQTIKFLINDKNELVSYDDSACLCDKATSVQTTYGLTLTVSQQNAIVKIDRPELRDYSIKLPV